MGFGTHNFKWVLIEIVKSWFLRRPGFEWRHTNPGQSHTFPYYVVEWDE